MEKKKVNKSKRLLKFLVVPILLFTLVIGSLCSFTPVGESFVSFIFNRRGQGQGGNYFYDNPGFSWTPPIVQKDYVLTLGSEYLLVLKLTNSDIVYSEVVTVSDYSFLVSDTYTYSGLTFVNNPDASALKCIYLTSGDYSGKYYSCISLQGSTDVSKEGFSSLWDLNIPLNKFIYDNFDYFVGEGNDNPNYWEVYLYEAPDSVEVMDIWTSIMNWIVSALSSVQAVFFSDGGLTFLGSLAIISVSIGLAFLVIAVISRFLSLRS